jgi:hypothetical protein
MKKIIKSLTPPIIIDGICFFKKLRLARRNKNLLMKNAEFKNLHKGKRCFILCNGPSVKEQNLIDLKDEIVFSVSNGYKHEFYHEIRPKYHVVPQVTFGAITERDVVNWFFEMSNQIESDIIFFSSQQFDLINSSNSFKKRVVRYVCMLGDFDNSLSLPSLEECIPSVQSVPILAIMIAMYMGFKDVYLLGVDHDWFIKKNYSYAFGKTLFSGKDIGVGPEGEMNDMRLTDQLPIAAALWGQYRSLNEIAKKNSINIYNSTAGGALDEFDRIDLNSVIRPGNECGQMN